MAKDISHVTDIKGQKRYVPGGKQMEKEVVLRGGKPWGFLVTGTVSDPHPRIDKIEPRGKAAKAGLCVGDLVLRINDVPVRNPVEAGDVVGAAFKTLTLKVARSDLDTSQSGTPHTAAYAKRVGDLREVDLDRSQDDSLVFIESPSKKTGTKLKNQRRGESFNLKNTGPAWGSTESRESTTPTPTKRKWSFKKFGFTKRSASTDQGTPKDRTTHHDYAPHGPSQGHGAGGGDLNTTSVSSMIDSHMVQSSPSLHQYTSMNSEADMVAGSPQNTSMAHSQSWQGGQDQLSSKSSTDFGYTQSNGEMTTESNGYSDNSVGKENRVPPGYKSLLEYKVSQINKSYSTSAIPASSTTTSAASKNQRRSNNYDPNPTSYSYMSEQSNDSSSYLSPRSNSVSSPHTPKDSMTGHRYDGDTNHHHQQQVPMLSARSYSDEASHKEYSDASSNDGHKQKGHSKNPSWPGDIGQTSVGHVTEESTVSGSWSDINAASPGPRSAKTVKNYFQPSLNPHFEEKIKPKDVRRQLEEHRLRSPKDPLPRQPMVAKADSETGRAFVFGSDSLEQHEISNKEADTSMHRLVEGGPTAQAPLSPSGSATPKDQSVLNDVSWNVVNTPSAGYMYIVRQKPCYNTSTQTDTPKPEPSDSLKSPSDSAITGLRTKAKALVTEDRAIQARPGSIVAASMPSGMKSVGVGSDQDYDNLEPWEQRGLQSPSRSSNLDTSEMKVSEGQAGQQRDVKRKSPRNSSVSSSKPYYLGDEDIAKIKEQTPDSAMLRKLSQEYFMQRNPGHRLSANMDEDGRKLTLPEEKPPDSPRRLRANDRALESKVSRTTKNALIEMRKDIEYYEKHENLNKTQTGAFEPVDCNDNHKTDRKTGLSPGGSYLGAFGVSSSGQKSKDSKPDNNTEMSQAATTEHSDTANMDTHSIAEQARKEWIQTGNFHKYGGPKTLKRTVSEQIRPSKELGRGKNKQSQVKHGSSNADGDNKHKVSDPGTDNGPGRVEHSYQSSDPTTNYQSYTTRENRLSSDGDSLLQKTHDRRQRPGSNVSNRSSSSGSTGPDEKNRISDPDLKRLQHKAVLNFFEMKTGKRLSSSSIDSNVGVDLTLPKDKSQDSWQSQKPSSPFKTASSEDRTTPVKKSLTSDTSRSPSRRRSSAGANLAPRRSTKESASEMSPPALLDTSSTPAMRGLHSYSSSATSTSLSPSDPQSPPLHPWPMDRVFPADQQSVEQVGGEVRAWPQGQAGEEEEEDVTEVKRAMMDAADTESKLHQPETEPENLDQTALKALQYSTSSADESPAGHSLSTDPRFSYHVSGKQAEEEAAPALPPRNYRNHFLPDSAPPRGQMPEPMEQPLREPRKDSQRSSGNLSDPQQQQQARLSSSSSFTDVFTSDYDATPARDMYADQLRQSARRISQSHGNPLLNPARYQSKPVAELKPSLATSRPVDKPSMATTAEPLHASVISSSNTTNNKDYSGLSSEGGDSPTHRGSSGNLQHVVHHSPKALSPKDRNTSSSSIGTPVNHHHTTHVQPSSKHHRNHQQASGDSDSYSSRHIHHSPQGSGSSDQGVYLTPVSATSSKGAGSASHHGHSPNSSDHRGNSQHTRRDSAHLSPNSDTPPTGRVNRLETSSDLDDLPSPPPLPPPHQPGGYHHSPSNSRLEDKPLPPLPPGQEADAQDRFSGESYISNKSNYRQAYGGNYRRGAELSPKSTVPYTPRDNNQTSTQPPAAGETMVTMTKMVSINKYPGDTTNTSPPQMSGKQDGKHGKAPGSTGSTPGSGALPWERKTSTGDAAPWTQKTYAPVQPFTAVSTASTPTSSSGISGNTSRQLESSPSGGSEEGGSTSESPSVKSVIANIEQRRRKDKRTPKNNPSKFANLKDTLDRRVYERNEREASGQQVRGAESTSSVEYSPGRRGDPGHSSMSSTEDVTSTPRAEARLYKRDHTKGGYSHSHTKSDPLRTDRLEFSPMTRTRSVESENLNYTRKTSDVSLPSPRMQPVLDSHSDELHNSYSCEARELPGSGQPSMDSFEISHSRERSDPQSDGDTRSNDSGVAEDISHSRQKSQEEIECEKQAALVASRLQDKHLSQVILPPPDHKTTTDYVTGLFDTRVNSSHRKSSLRNTAATRAQIESAKRGGNKMEESTPTKSPSSTTLPANSPYWSPPSLANLQNKMRQEGVQADDILASGEIVSLESEKDELIVRIEKKLEILREEKTLLELEIKENEALGKELSEVVSVKVPNKAEYNKYQLYVTELDKVMILLLKLSGRLARAENAVNSLQEDATHDQRSPLLTKRDELLEKLEDAKLLKEGIDRRSKQVSVILRKQLTDSEYEDYEYYIKLKSKLTMDQQEISDKLKLGEEQLSALRKSRNQSDC